MLLTILSVSIVSQIFAEETGDAESGSSRLSVAFVTKDKSGSPTSLTQIAFFDAPTPFIKLYCGQSAITGESKRIKCTELIGSQIPKGLSAYQKLVTDNEWDFVQRYDCADTLEKFSRTHADAGNMRCEKIIQETS
ncbi:MAG: hypothetical protein MHMPM18_000914 [Marteilia pararefringens]